MAKTNDTSFSTDQTQISEKRTQEKQSKATLQKLLSEEKTGKITAKEENTDQKKATTEENVGHIEITENEDQPKVVGHIGAKEEKEITEKERIDYTPLDWGKDDNISDFLVTMLSGNLSDWAINNAKFAGQYVDIASERASDFNKKIEKDKKLQQTITNNMPKQAKQVGLQNNIQKFTDVKNLNNISQNKQQTPQKPTPNLIQTSRKNGGRG